MSLSLVWWVGIQSLDCNWLLKRLYKDPFCNYIKEKLSVPQLMPNPSGCTKQIWSRPKGFENNQKNLEYEDSKMRSTLGPNILCLTKFDQHLSGSAKGQSMRAQRERKVPL